MSLVFGSLVDPFAQSLLLLIGQGLSAVERRHVVVVVRGQKDPVDQFAFLGIPLDDHRIPRLGRFKCSRLQVKPQTALPFLFIRSVAMETGIR